MGLRRALPAAIVGFSGLMAGPPPADGGPPVLLTHGTEDTVIPASALFMGTAMLAAAKIPVQWHLSPGIGHGIDGHALGLAGEFLALAFAGKLHRDGDKFCAVPEPSQRIG